MSAYFATVLRLTPNLLAISARGTPSASIDRISFIMSRGTAISSILPRRARQSLRPGTPYGEGRDPGPRGRGPHALSAQFSMTTMLKKRWPFRPVLSEHQHRHRQDAHGLRTVHVGARAEDGGPLLHRVIARHATAKHPRQGGASAARPLAIDELGFLPPDPDGARLLFQAFVVAHEQQSMAITTNLEFCRWGAALDEDQIAAAAIGRIVHHGRLVQFKSESHRMRNALMQEG